MKEQYKSIGAPHCAGLTASLVPGTSDQDEDHTTHRT